MMVLVTGGASSGKSAFAEDLALRLPGPHYYFAAMKPYGEEAERRIARHRDLRAGKGFTTVECHGGLKAACEPLRGGPPVSPWDGRLGETQDGWPVKVRDGRLERVPVERVPVERVPDDGTSKNRGLLGGTALLECLGNVVANELFSDDGRQVDPAEALQAVLDGVEALAGACGNLVVVGNEVGADGVRYDDGTEAYIEVLGAASCALAQRCDAVVECVYGHPKYVKGGLLP